MKQQCFSTLKILATVKLNKVTCLEAIGFSTLKILATVKHNTANDASAESFSTLKILATVKQIDIAGIHALTF